MVSVREGWTSSAYGERRVAPAIVVECEGEGPQQLVSLLLPQSTGAGPASVSQSRGVYSISTADSFDLIACPSEFDARSALLSARCQMAWARFIEGRLSKGCLIRGSRLEIVGGITLWSPIAIPWLSFSTAADQLYVRTRGATHIEMGVNERARSLTINETRFDLPQGKRRLSLKLAESGWSLESKR